MAGYRAGKRFDAFKQFREQHDDSSVTTDERVMQALTYPTQAAARERMHIDFNISNLSAVTAATDNERLECRATFTFLTAVPPRIPLNYEQLISLLTNNRFVFSLHNAPRFYGIAYDQSCY